MKTALPFVLVGLILFMVVVAAQGANVVMSGTAPTARADEAHTPLPLSELKECKFYRNGAVFKTVPPAATYTYTHEVPSGSCFSKSDVWTSTCTDATNQESVASTPVSLVADACTPKAKPLAPSNVKVVGG